MALLFSFSLFLLLVFMYFERSILRKIFWGILFLNYLAIKLSENGTPDEGGQGVSVLLFVMLVQFSVLFVYYFRTKRDRL